MSEEDMLQVHGKAVCKWCAADIAKERFGSRLTKRALDGLVCPQCLRELHNGYCSHCKAAFEIARQ
jgi:ATP-dependent Clp protease adapter protein ClpS